jgi:hypothetical protein
MSTETYNKFLAIFKSRKFWAALIAIITSVGTCVYGEITVWQMIQAIVATIAAYVTGVAIEDAGSNISGSNAS